MNENDILNRPFKAVYDELMANVGVSSGKTFARNWVCRNTTKLSGRNELGAFSTVMDFLNDFNNDLYSCMRGNGPTTNNYINIFARKVKEKINDSD